MQASGHDEFTREVATRAFGSYAQLAVKSNTWNTQQAASLADTEQTKWGRVEAANDPWISRVLPAGVRSEIQIEKKWISLPHLELVILSPRASWDLPPLWIARIELINNALLVDRAEIVTEPQISHREYFFQQPAVTQSHGLLVHYLHY